MWDGTADITLPYIKGYVPPYYVTIINYTVSDLQGYITEQTHEGWMVTFSDLAVLGVDLHVHLRNLLPHGRGYADDHQSVV